MKENFSDFDENKPEVKIDIKSMFLEDIKTDFLSRGYKRFRAIQVYEWLTRGMKKFSEMTNIPKDLQKNLDEIYSIFTVEIVRKQISKDGSVKYLFRLHDGAYIESVLLKYKYGYSVCVSTQVGCRMRCKFCATGKIGFKRNLAPSEMLSQIQEIQRDNDIRVSNVVLMGMGEPFDNYDNVINFLKLVSEGNPGNNLNIGIRHISVSTCGLADKIRDFADENIQATLSFSLHATTDETRNALIPMNRRWNIRENLEACKHYIENTNRRVLIEYAMISGVNDTSDDAKRLSELLSGMLCHVNLIPVNTTSLTNEFVKSNEESIKNFMNILKKHKISFTVRRTLGDDIDAACGQLSARFENF